MPLRGFRLTFLWRFTIVTVLVSVVAAVLLAVGLENAHRRAIESDIEVSALGRMTQQLTQPLNELAAARRLTPEILKSLERAQADAALFQYVTGLRIYRPDGSPIYPVTAPVAQDEVHRTLASESFLQVDRGSTISAYSPTYTKSEQIYVIALDFEPGLLGVQFAKERSQVFGIVAIAVGIIFVSLITLAAGASRELERRRRESQSSFVDTLKVMAHTIDLRDPYTAGHSQRVGEYSRKLATEMRLSQREIDVIESAALLHDIGKIAIADAVLFKPSALDAAEREIIGTHPVVGANLLGTIASMEDVVPCVMHHHEKIDGTGYPDRLHSDQIPLGARVIAVADSFDAMTTDRPYRRAMTADIAVAELVRVAGTQLDERCVVAFGILVARGEIVPPQPAHHDVDVAFGRKHELEIA
ncbi:MAG: hypothetical protein NVSMB64_12930 [Candidatus Velthaea sp.]